ncbi:MAG: hypothetical protein GY953_05885, partial [bacterium]|nr:hypothetical protein [bacterium]
MKPRVTRFRRARKGWLSPGILFTVFTGLFGLCAVLWALGFIELAFLPPPSAFAKERPEDRIPDRTGQVAIVIAGRNLTPYTRLRMSDLAVVWKKGRAVREPLVSKEDWALLLDRVLRVAKPAGDAVTLDDIYPPGTREGLVAGIPPGKRAMRVEAGKLKGVFGLKLRDTFDLVATLPLDPKELGDFKVGGVFSDQMAMEAGASNWKKQATVKVVVQAGVVVLPVESRIGSLTSRSLMKGSQVHQKPVTEIVIAVEPSEVAPLTEALAIGADITCVPRSGHPDEDPATVTPPLRPRTPFSARGGDSE